MSLDDLRDEHGVFRVLAVDHRDSLRRSSTRRSRLGRRDDAHGDQDRPRAGGVAVRHRRDARARVLDPAGRRRAAPRASVSSLHSKHRATSTSPGLRRPPCSGRSSRRRRAARPLPSCCCHTIPTHRSRRPRRPSPPTCSRSAAGSVSRSRSNRCSTACRRPMIASASWSPHRCPVRRPRTRPAQAAVPGRPDDRHRPPRPHRGVRSVTERCRQPWALLSGGGSFDVFAEQVTAALEGGCAGFMVGRALWGEAATCPAERRPAVIDDVVLPRWHRLTRIVDAAVADRSAADGSEATALRHASTRPRQ